MNCNTVPRGNNAQPTSQRARTCVWTTIRNRGKSHVHDDLTWPAVHHDNPLSSCRCCWSHMYLIILIFSSCSSSSLELCVGRDFVSRQCWTLTGWGISTLKRWRDLRHFLFVFQECAERQCFENEIHFARLAAPLVIATWAWQSHICRRKKPSFSSSSFITLSFFFRLLYVVGLSPFREITGELGNRERWDAPTFIISFKFNLQFLFDRLRSPAIG